MTKRPKHDQLFKKIMGNEIAAQEFLEYYLPNNFKEKIDLSKIKIEQESYIEESLRRKYSDIVYSVKTKNDESAFIYVLLDHQSTSDYWMALRLWRYTLLLCERHKKNEGKLPLICPIIMYNGVDKYHAPRNLWNLFTDSEQAKKLMTEDYQLVDLQSMSDDEIVQKKHLGMMEYVMKHIHQRDMIKLWEQFLERFKLEILVDKENGYIYLRSFLWYTDARLPEEKQSELEQLLAKYLSEEEKGNIMRTIAQKYIDEGEARGEARGEEKKAMAVAKNLLKVGVSIDIISTSTGLSKKAIEELMV
ncbi:Rpn family recombination-promoting nuclease/putative transposase [Candidatus Tisiphia endosymbiont of Xenochironomus xenolabis]|uniref:Rpn family recombination-promoting nuclease/putative transposase n=1 Tax=Candidatus Tisiphia endosymbiont of Xenochironomus xenolabis TaxID=3139334 RepID=UPI0035C88CEF